MVAQRSARVLRRLRQAVLICGTVASQLVGRTRTTACEREDCGARSVRSCDGRKSYDHRDILLEIFEIVNRRRV